MRITVASYTSASRLSSSSMTNSVKEVVVSSSLILDVHMIGGWLRVRNWR